MPKINLIPFPIVRKYLLEECEIERQGPKYNSAGHKFERLEIKLIMKSSGDTSGFEFKDILSAVIDQFKELKPSE